MSGILYINDKPFVKSNKPLIKVLIIELFKNIFDKIEIKIFIPNITNKLLILFFIELIKQIIIFSLLYSILLSSLML